MAGISPYALLDWALDTGPSFLSGPDGPGAIRNQVSSRSFVLGKMLREKEFLQGGDVINETLYLSAKRTFQIVGRNEQITWTNPQKDVNVTYRWKTALDSFTWDELERITQKGGKSGVDLAVKYKNVIDSKWQRVWDSTIQGMEDKAWAPPNSAATFTAMESADGKEPYSIPVFVHENGSNSGGFDSNWTTVGGITQATYSTNWDNKRRQYDYADPADLNGNSTGVFNALDKLSIDVNYRQPGFKDEYFESNEAMGNPYGICTSLTGKALIMDLHRKGNDRLIRPEDAAYPKPRWNNIPIEDVQGLDNAQLYTTGSTYVDELDATVTNAGPRFYLLNFDELKLVFHEDRFFYTPDRPKEPTDRVEMFVIPVISLYNLICTNRRVQGIAYPGA